MAQAPDATNLAALTKHGWRTGGTSHEFQHAQKPGHLITLSANGTGWMHFEGEMLIGHSRYQTSLDAHLTAGVAASP